MEDEVDIPEGTVAYGNSFAHEAALRYHEGPLTFATDPTTG